LARYHNDLTEVMSFMGHEEPRGVNAIPRNRLEPDIRRLCYHDGSIFSG
jgi:hypothetical protein